MVDKLGTPLTSLSNFPDSLVVRLAEFWLTTAEEFVAVAMQPSGQQELARQFGLSRNEINQLFIQALTVVSPDVSFGPDESIAHGLGALDEPPVQAPKFENSVDTTPLPVHIELHEYMTAVRDQGARGTCVPHACLAIHEYLLRNTQPRLDLSEQFLYWSCKRRDGYSYVGTNVHTALSSLQIDGVCEEHIWPYNPKELEGNEGQGPPPLGAIEVALRYMIGKSTQLSTRGVTDWCRSLAQSSPIVCVIPVYSYWVSNPISNYGDIRLPLPFEIEKGNHAMCVTGYTDNPNVPGGGFFLVRNSWGVAWASEQQPAGYCRLPYRYVEQRAVAAYTFQLASFQEKK